MFAFSITSPAQLFFNPTANLFANVLFARFLLLAYNLAPEISYLIDFFLCHNLLAFTFWVINLIAGNLSAGLAATTLDIN